MTSLRKFTTSAALAVALLLQPTPANALDVTVGQPPEVSWGGIYDALKDHQLSASDLVAPAFQAFWSAASNVISRTNICREAYADGRRPPFTFYINMTVVSADGSSSVTYSHPVDVVALPRGVLGVGVRGSGTGYIKLFRCGDVGGMPETAEDDAALAQTLTESRQFSSPLSHEARGGADSFILATAHGRVIVNLPDDMAAGDTISGTVYIEPEGGGDAERRANTDTLRGYVVDVGGTQVRAAEGVFRIAVPASGLVILALSNGGTPLASELIRAAPAVTAGVGQIEIPPIAQAGRPASVPGPFDGDLSNTQVSIGGQPCPILAESPRQTVLASPNAPTGQLPVQIRDGAHSAEGVINNVGISLSMPRTTLTRGERTRVTLQVAGLQGIEQPIQVTLWASSNVNLQGGNQQTITINPAAANAAGAFDQQFDLRVTTAGSFDVSAGLINPVCTDPIESAAEQAYRQALRNAQSAERARANARRALDEAQRAVDNFEGDYGEALAAGAVANRDGDAAGAARAEADRERAQQNLEAARRLRNQRQYQLEQAQSEEVEALGAVRGASEGITEAQREAIAREEIARAYNQGCGIR